MYNYILLCFSGIWEDSTCYWCLFEVFFLRAGGTLRWDLWFCFISDFRALTYHRNGLSNTETAANRKFLNTWHCILSTGTRQIVSWISTLSLDPDLLFILFVVTLWQVQFIDTYIYCIFIVSFAICSFVLAVVIGNSFPGRLIVISLVYLKSW